MQDSKLQFAIIGYGYIADRHLAAIENIGGKLVAVVDCDKKKKEKLDSDVKFFESFDRLIEHKIFDDIDWIVICTPNYLHVPFIEWVTSQGKDVLCEKPLTIDYADLQELEKIKDRKIFVVQQLRFSKKLQDLKEKLNGEKDGAMIELNLKMYRGDFYWNGWKGDEVKSGGLLFNIGVHYFDLLCWFFGEPLDWDVEYLDDRKAKGTVKFGRAYCYWSIDLTVEKDDQCRVFTVNGESINLTRILESLHNKVYDALVDDKGVTIHDVKPVTNLCQQLTKTLRYT